MFNFIIKVERIRFYVSKSNHLASFKKRSNESEELLGPTPGWCSIWTFLVSREQMGRPSKCDLLCRHPCNLWMLQTWRSRRPGLSWHFKKHTGGDNAKHRLGEEDKEDGERSGRKGGKTIIAFAHILLSCDPHALRWSLKWCFWEAEMHLCFHGANRKSIEIRVMAGHTNIHWAAVN